MPHAVFNLGNLAAPADVAGTARMFIPGIEPGMGIRNIFAQNRMKRALLIRDCVLVYNHSIATGALAPESMQYYLKLSQEPGLNPGLLLRVGVVNVCGNGTDTNSVQVEQQFQAQGSIWPALYMGIRVEEYGTMDVDCDIELDYEVVEIPWQEWFVGWEHLQNIIDNTREY